MNNDFTWNLQAAAEAIPQKALEERAKRNFFRPHESIWPEDDSRFTGIADEIHDNLDPVFQSRFLSVCLASYLLNQAKSSKDFPAWFQRKTSIRKLLGLDLSLDEITSYRWGRAALPGVDLVGGWNDKVVYAMVGSSKNQGEKNLLTPSWAPTCMNNEARHSVQLAASLAADESPGAGFLFWPMLDPILHPGINGNSLGLPVYLSFWSVANNLPVPQILATGALDPNGGLLAVGGLEEKFALANNKDFSAFIYPLLPGVVPPESSRRIDPKGVSNLASALDIWKGSDLPGNVRLAKLLTSVPLERDSLRLAEKFVGREWLVDQINEWILNPNGTKVFLLSGSFGMGKSALAARFCANSGYIAAYYFCDNSSNEKCNPVTLVHSLASQLARFLPEYGERLSKLPVDKFSHENHDTLILQPLAGDYPPPAQPCIILIDALDEATTGTQNAILLLLSQLFSKTPEWLRLIITSRPDLNVAARFKSIERVMLDGESSANQSDLSAYLSNRLPSITEEQRRQILERSEGLFLYVVHVCNDVASGRLSLARLDEFPWGMNGVYLQNFDRQFGKHHERFRDELRDLLSLVLAVHEPLNVGLLSNILRLKNRMILKDRLNLLGSLFPIVGEGDTAVITLSHQSLKHWLASEESGPYFIDSEFGHSLLADFGWKVFEHKTQHLPPYFLAWLPRHLVACGRQLDAVALLKDFAFMMARVEAGFLSQMLADYRELRDEGIVDPVFRTIV